MIEPYEGDRIGTWPYADTVWVDASLDQPAVAKLLAPLEPDEVRNAAVPEDDWDLKPPLPAADGFTPFWIWWD